MHKRTSHSNQAYLALKEKMTSGQLLPGAVVSEASLAKELGLSRTPIGEALRRLSHEGLVNQIPRFGTVVRECSPEELREWFEIREALEGLAASKAAQSITEGALEELELLCVSIDGLIDSVANEGGDRLEGTMLSRFLEADKAIHMLIISSARNRRLSDLVEQTRSISSTFTSQRGVHSIERVAEANSHHHRIVAALAGRDSIAARELIMKHIRTSCEQSISQSSVASDLAPLGAPLAADK